MAKPDLTDGWLRYAHELDAALAVADFTKGARIVLHEVFEQIFGPPKLKTATLSPTEIADAAGMAKPNIARAIKDLTDSGVLSRAPDGAYRFNKNYETWTRNGAPRLSRAEVSYCHAAPERAVNRGISSTPVAVIQLDNPSTKNVIQLDNPSTKSVIYPDNGGVIQRDNETLSNEITNPSPPKNPLVGGRIREAEQSNSRGAAGENPPGPEADVVRVLRPTPAGPPDPALMPPFPGGMGPMDLVSGPHTLADADAEAIYARVWAAWGNARLCREFYSHQRLHSAPTWRAAVRRLVEQGVTPGSIQLVHLKAGDFEVKPAAANGRHAPAERPVAAHPVHRAPADSPFRRLAEAEAAKRRAGEGGGS